MFLSFEYEPFKMTLLFLMESMEKIQGTTLYPSVSKFIVNTDVCNNGAWRSIVWQPIKILMHY